MRKPRCGWLAISKHQNGFWLNLQTQFDLETEKDRLGDRLDREATSLVTPN